MHDTVIEDRPYSIFLDEETGQRLSIPHEVSMQASMDPMTVAIRERGKLREAQAGALEAQKIATPQVAQTPAPTPMPESRARLQGVIDEFDRGPLEPTRRPLHTQASQPGAVVPQPGPSAPLGMPMPNAQAERGPGSFADVIAEMRRRAMGL